MNLLFFKILTMSIYAGVLALIVLVVRSRLNRMPKLYSYLLWSIVFFRLLCPFSYEVELGFLKAEDVPFSDGFMKVETVNRIEQTETEQNEKSNLAESNYSYSNVNDTYSDGKSAQSHSNVPNVKYIINTTDIITYVWFAGVIIMLTTAISSYLGLKKKTRTAFIVRDNIFESYEVSTGFLLGYVSPRIIIPARMDRQQAETVILHEQIHMKRGDNVVKLVSFIALSIHWFNPMVWVSFLLMCRDMESSCDEAVIRKMCTEGGEISDVRRKYGNMLLSSASQRKIIPISFGSGNIKERMMNIMNFRIKRTVTGAVIYALIFALLLVPAGCSISPYQSYVDGIRVRRVSIDKALSDPQDTIEQLKSKGNFNYEDTKISIPQIDSISELTVGVDYAISLDETDESLFYELISYWLDIGNPSPDELYCDYYDSKSETGGLISFSELNATDYAERSALMFSSKPMTAEYQHGYFGFSKGVIRSNEHNLHADNYKTDFWYIPSLAHNQSYSLEYGESIDGVSAVLTDGKEVALSDAIQFAEQKLNSSPLFNDDYFYYSVCKAWICSLGDNNVYHFIITPNYQNTTIEHETNRHYYFYDQAYSTSNPTPTFIEMYMAEDGKIDILRAFTGRRPIEAERPLEKIIDFSSALALMENYIKADTEFDVLSASFTLVPYPDKLKSVGKNGYNYCLIDKLKYRPMYKFEIVRSSNPRPDNIITLLIDAQTGKTSRFRVS